MVVGRRGWLGLVRGGEADLDGVVKWVGECELERILWSASTMGSPHHLARLQWCRHLLIVLPPLRETRSPSVAALLVDLIRSELIQLLADTPTSSP